MNNRYPELAKENANYEREQSTNTSTATKPIYEKKKVPAFAIVLIVIFGVLVLSLGAIIPFAIYHNNVNLKVTESEIQAETIKTGETMHDSIQNITVDADAREFTLEVTDEVEEPEFVYYGEASRKPTIDDKNGVINIESRHHGIQFHFPFGNITEKCTLTVKIPTSMFQNTKMNLTLDAGDVHLTRIPNGEVVADLDAGNLIVSECTLDNIKIEADAGNVELKNNHIKAVEAEVDAGNFEMHFDGPKGVYAYDLSADLGNVSINDEKHAGVDSEYKVEKEANVAGYEDYRQVKVEADLGNIEIHTN